eukprot:8924020-Pyramimonas_sp.AAC.1
MNHAGDSTAWEEHRLGDFEDAERAADENHNARAYPSSRARDTRAPDTPPPNLTSRGRRLVDVS